MNIFADQYTFSTLIKGCKKQARYIKKDENYKRIFGWLDELINNNIEIDCVLYNCIMDVCVIQKDIEKALEVQKTMCNQDVKPNYVSFGILIKAYGIKGDLNKCMEIFDS